MLLPGNLVPLNILDATWFRFCHYSRNPHKKPRFFLSSPDRFLNSELVFLIPACKVLNKVLTYSTCSACIYIVSAQELLMILENNLKSEFLCSNLVIC